MGGCGETQDEAHLLVCTNIGTTCTKQDLYDCTPAAITVTIKAITRPAWYVSRLQTGSSPDIELFDAPRRARPPMFNRLADTSSSAIVTTNVHPRTRQSPKCVRQSALGLLRGPATCREDTRRLSSRLLRSDGEAGTLAGLEPVRHAVARDVRAPGTPGIVVAYTQFSLYTTTIRTDTALEAFRRNPADGSVAPPPARASARPNVRTCGSSRTEQDY
ncbi:hypothetical protein M8J77_018581 [Diaphorina citri]|nr:hypothetical protein M8J77_018581 [Diaphorina citri]